MKILAIRIKNLASLEGVTKIDFTQEPLCSAGIFAITGPTGAGKSTILDAICLALYGKTPRYIQAREVGIELQDTLGNKISQGDVKAILRDGTGDGFAEVDFVGTDGAKYSAAWSVKRAYGKPEGALQAESIILTNLESGIIFPAKKVETLQEIEKLVGLNFEQFTRSVLLAQGDFTAFLKANKDEKASLLEKLTGSFIYSEISKLVYERSKQADQNLRDLQLQKEGILTFTNDELKFIEEQQQLLGIQVTDLEKSNKSLEAEQIWHLRLSELSLDKSNAEDDWNAAIEQKNNSRVRSTTLQRANDAQQIKSFVDSRQQETDIVDGKKATIETTQITIATQTETLNSKKSELQGFEKQLKTYKQTKTEATPLIEAAKKLDVLIDEKNSQIATADESLTEISIEKATHDEQCSEKTEEILGLNNKIEDLQAWKTENAHRQPLADNIGLISSKLQDAEKLLETASQIKNDVDANTEKLKTISESQSGLETTITEIAGALKIKEGALETEKKEIKLIDANDLRIRKIALDNQIEDIISGTAQWKLYYQALTTQLTLKKRIEDGNGELTETSKSLRLAKEVLASSKITKETSAKLLENARLKVAENVETLRSLLKDNEPCPVCGSPEHPYVDHSQAFNSVLASIEQDHLANENRYETSLAAFNNLTQICQSLTKQISSDDTNLKSINSEVAELLTKWETHQIHEECKAISDEKKEAWLNEKTKTIKAEQLSLQQKLDHHTNLKLKIETDQLAIDRQKTQLQKLTDQLKDYGHQKSLLENASTQLIQQAAKCRTDLQVLQDELSPYFQAVDWFANWQEKPLEFSQALKIFAESWVDKLNKLSQHQQQLSVSATALKGLESKSIELTNRFEKAQKTSNDLKENFNNINVERNALFDGQPVADVQFKMDLDIQNSEGRINAAKIELQEIQDNLTKANTLHNQLNKDVILYEKRIENNSQKITSWIESYNTQNASELTEVDIIALLSYSYDWLEQEKHNLKAIDDAVTTSSSILQERKGHLDKHLTKRISERELEDIQALFAQGKEKLNSANQDKSENTFKLQQDAINKTKIGKLLSEIENRTTVAENWGKLNDIIGSADGKKFRQIAQEFTLDVLLIYANIHMQMLSKRYHIERIPNTLGLQVIDKDMGDETRTVYSLSGGESFLVSLALALGLAELSSNKMNVESLFIDEGFGSLDPITLTIAMSALEGLHNQGRKVGVISHVQEMTERIPAQIRVNKLANGKSEIEIGVL